MNYFELYPGDYQRDTGHLSLTEHGAFLLLLCAYYGSEKPIPAQNDALFRITKAMNSAEKKAALSVANEFFPVGEDGLRHNARADAELEKAAGRMEANPTDRKASQAERAKRYRDRRSAMFKLLREHGVVLDFNVKAEELEAAVMALASRNSRDGERDITRDERDDVQRDVTASRPQTPDPSNTPERSLGADRSLSSASEPPRALSPTLAAECCLAARRGGLMQTNPSHPALLAAIAEGATPEQFQHTAKEAAEQGKGFAWVIATVRGRNADATRAPQPRQQQPNTTGPRSQAGQAIVALEALKSHGNHEPHATPDGLDLRRDPDGPSATFLPGPRSATRR